MPVFIYGLKCPIAGVIRYVGKSINPKSRMQRHVNEARYQTRHHHTARWIRSLQKAGLAPELVILHCVSEGERWQDVERSFIASAKEHGWQLTNSTAGGEGLDYTDPMEKKKWAAKVSASLKEVWNTPERKQEASQRSLKAWADPVITGKRLASYRKAQNDPEHKKRMREVSREIGARPEVKAARSAKLKVFSAKRLASLRSPETSAKMSTSAKARFSKPGAKAYLSSPEAKARMTEIAIRRSTPEYRAQASARMKATWLKRKANS